MGTNNAEEQNWTLQDAVNAFLLSKRGVNSEKTIKWYHWKLDSLLEFFGKDHSIKSITLHELRKWRASLSDRNYRYRSDHCLRKEDNLGLSVESLRGFVRAIRTFFKWLETEGILEQNIAQTLKMPPKEKKPRKGIADQDRDRILRASTKNIRDHALVKFIDDTGCREAGAAGLTFENLDLENLRAVVYEKGLGGNNKSREVYFHDDTAEALDQWLTVRKNLVSGTDERVFGLVEAGVYQVFKRLAQRTGVKKRWSPHQWRHSCGRRWTQAGMPLGVVAQLLGHEDPSITVEYYGQFSNRELQQLHRKYTKPA